MSATSQLIDPTAPSARSAQNPEGGFAVRLVLCTTLAFAAFLLVVSAVLLLIHPQSAGLGGLASSVNQQNQNAKTALYVATFLLILPTSLLVASRLATTVEAGPNRDAFPGLVALLGGSLMALLIAIRLSHRLPWGDGMGTVLVAAAGWSAGAGLALRRVSRARAWPLIAPLQRHAVGCAICAGLLMFGVLLGTTSLASISLPGLLICAVIAVVVFAVAARGRVRRLEGWPGVVLELVIVAALLLAVPNVVLFRHAPVIPNIFGGAGIVQFQHDYLLGPVNQLLGGGALLVNVPVSQYGVGVLYFIAGWFHLAPIGYGTFGALDSLLTALFYVAAYATLRIVGVGRGLASGALLVAVLAFIYNLYFAVGQLPEQGPLRFGLPMVVLLAAVIAERWPGRRRLADAAGLFALGISSVWALEAFAYTALVWAALAAAGAWLQEGEPRTRSFFTRLALGLGACVACHVSFALITLAGSGHLPDWGQYLAYAHAFLFGGEAGTISYGFARWSPGLALGAGTLASAAAVILLAWRLPLLARAQRVAMIALTGATAYEVAMLSYTDNRSSTYLLPYVALPLSMAGAIWLSLLVRSRSQRSAAWRGGVAFALSLAVLLVAVAWPRIGSRFEFSALAHAYPGGRLGPAIHRLWHMPPVDQRAPEGGRLLRRFMPQSRVLIVLPTTPDLGTEILMRTRRANLLFIGDPKADGLVPSVWRAKLTREVASLRSGQRLLTDRVALALLPQLRRTSSAQIESHPIGKGATEVEWLLRAIDQRFRIVPLYRDPDGLIVAELVAR